MEWIDSTLKDIGFKSIFFTLLLCSANFSQNQPNKKGIMADPNASGLLEYSPRSIAMGGISFSNPSWFNAYDINGAPMGLLQREIHDFRMMLGHNYSTQSGNDDRELSENNFYLPVFYFNQPGTMGSTIYYRKINDHVVADSVDQELSLHNLGFNVALGLRNKFFQASLSGHGLWGTATDTIGNERFLLNIEKLEVGFGSQPHPLVQLGAKFGATGSIDTLNSITNPVAPGDPGVIYERRGTMDFPNYGFFVDFGDTTLHPLLINIGMNFTKERIWGQHKYFYYDDPSIDPADSLEFKYNPRWTNGFELNWNGMYYMTKDDYSYRPSMVLGIWRRTTERKIQGHENKDPFKIQGTCEDGVLCNTDSLLHDQAGFGSQDWANFLAMQRHSGDGTYHNWNIWGIDWGLGYSQVISKYAVLYTEFEVNSINFNLAADDDNDDFKVYNRILIGGEWNVHSLPAWTAPDWFLLFLRAGFVTGTENSNFRRYRPYQYQFHNRYTLAESDLINREFFQPDIGDKLDWTSVNLGLGTSLWGGKLEADFMMSFFSQKSEVVDDDFLGVEYGTQIRGNF